MVCLFETISGALEFGDYIMAHMPHVKNKPEIFGEQRILDEEDQLLGLEENLLLVSSFVGDKRGSESDRTVRRNSFSRSCGPGFLQRYRFFGGQSLRRLALPRQR